MGLGILFLAQENLAIKVQKTIHTRGGFGPQRWAHHECTASFPCSLGRGDPGPAMGQANAFPGLLSSHKSRLSVAVTGVPHPLKPFREVTWTLRPGEN